jgi:hypothetical protein
MSTHLFRQPAFLVPSIGTAVILIGAAFAGGVEAMPLATAVSVALWLAPFARKIATSREAAARAATARFGS